MSSSDNTVFNSFMTEEDIDKVNFSVVADYENKNEYALLFVEKWKDIDPADQMTKFTIYLRKQISWELSK